MNTVYRRTYDMFVRPNTSDDFICDESYDYSNLFIDAKPYDVLLDIGANIGAVSKLAKKIQEHLTIISYEPDEDNFNLLTLNMEEEYNISLVNSAVGDGIGTVDFYTENGSFKAKHSTKIREFKKGHNKVKVNQVDFRNEIIKNKATILKIDIEGGEYDLILDDLPETIRAVAIEFHLIQNDHSVMFHTYNVLKDQFPYVIGEVPEENSLEYFKFAYKEKDAAFMCIFLRN